MAGWRLTVIRWLSAPFDVTDHAASRQGVDEIERDIEHDQTSWSNNAGMQHRAPLEEFPAERWDELLRTDVSSVLDVGQAAARRMIERGRGKIIDIGSAQSELARPRHRSLHSHQRRGRDLTCGMATD